MAYIFTIYLARYLILYAINYTLLQKMIEKKKETETVELATWIHLSNVMLWDQQTTQASRIGYKTLEGKKKRYFRKSGNILQ